MNHIVILVILIVLSGTLGGIVSFLSELNKKEAFLKNRNLYKSILVGISASMLVPLFLNTISSNLINESETDNNKLLVIIGFCLIASISSKRFIQSMSERVLNELKEVKEEVKDVKKDVDVLAEKETEDESKIIEIEEKVKSTDNRVYNPDDSNRVKVLKCLTDSRYSFRSLKGLSEQTELSESLITDLINELINDKYVDQSVREKGIRFFITKEGREFLHFYNTTSYAPILEKHR
ncbi:YEATS-associated helix-containing protein [Paenibacillus alvei]|uniref:YEATS-Like-Associating Three TM domain-containing protein n=1 Tax=Paenibacillus alvei TaxID=44250 RepID=A0A383RDZ4_PAEAL|nr:YEATS-associated helix-containing protein [Paenibacillus alvei]SYX85053.1 conserved membrane protein of unknown function [Paenibacillus alvei]